MFRSLVFLLLIDTCCSAATVKMSVGWDGAYRVGRWTPVFVTASDSAPRNVILEVYASHDQKDGIRIRQNATITPLVTTFVLYVPLGVSLDDLSVALLDPKTEQRLATATTGDSYSTQHPLLADAVSQLVVISGSPDSSPILQSQLNDSGVISCRWIDPIRLPSVALGYDAMNLLILNSPDLGKISADQQDAMIDWIRGGGNLLCWIGPDALPNSSPLLDALPATVGSNGAVTISSHVFSSRELTPALNARKIALLDGQITAWQRRVGFGSITLLPIDPAGLNFDNPGQWLAFWSPLLDGAVDPRSRVAQEQVADDYVDAIVETRQALGATDGASNFDFGQIWLILLISTAIVGPLDWLVLKKLNRRPWTVSTAGGWMGFILLCAVGIVRASTNRPATVRSFELIDQADGIGLATVRAVNQDAGPANPHDWCEPLAADKTILERAPSRADLDLHEDQHSAAAVQSEFEKNLPQMLLCQSIDPSAPAISAELRRQSKDGKPNLVGTITNLGKSTLNNPTIRTQDGACAIGPIAPGATIKIDLPLTPGGIPPPRIWNLTPTRTSQIDGLLSRDENLACFTADGSIGPSQGIYIRALISLGH